jgi:Subtilase family
MRLTLLGLSLLVNALPAHALELDPIDAKTGEQLDRDGRVPRRVDDLSTPSYANLGDEQLWREIKQAGGRVFVVVKRPDERRGFFRGRVLISKGDIERTRNELLETIPGLRAAAEAGALPRTAQGMVFPGFYADLESIESLQLLRRHGGVDYIEPFTFLPQDGCGFDPYVPSTAPELQDGKLFIAMRQDIVPYSFRHLKITDAWDRVTNPGQGVTLAVLDTGLSAQQDQLNGQFTNGAPRAPTSQFDETGTGIDDTCGHGTKVASLAIAPHDGRNIVGAMWGANLVSAKVGNGVSHWNPPLVSTSSVVCQGVIKAVNGGAQITNMSFGFLFASPVVRECISTVFDTTPMIFVAAAGTNVPNVIFPASMNREVVAASAVRITPTAYELFASGITYGPDVDFVSVMGDNRLPSSGRIGNVNVSELAAGGGTSSAAPHIASIIGLTIQSRPNATRAQILAAVHAASSTEAISASYGGSVGPNVIGAGMPNTYEAVGGMTRLDVEGPAQLQIGQTGTYKAVANGTAQKQYFWTANQYSQTATIAAATAPGATTHWVTVVDPVDGRARSRSFTVTTVAAPVAPPTTRTLTSVAVIYHNPAWASGGQFDQTINTGVSMPAGCVVTLRQAHLQCPDGMGGSVDCSQTVDQIVGSYGSRGFTIDQLVGSGSSLQATAHFWHDAFEGVALRIKYTVTQPAGVQCSVPGKTF